MVQSLAGRLLGPDVWVDGGPGPDGAGLQLQGAPLHAARREAAHCQAGIHYSVFSISNFSGCMDNSMSLLHNVVFVPGMRYVIIL